MKRKQTEALTGKALDWAAAKADGCEWLYENLRANPPPGAAYSTDWAQGGPIIERERIIFEQYSMFETDGRKTYVYLARLEPTFKFHNYSSAMAKPIYGEGPTHLIAAMRCFIASKLGDEVEIPEELT